MLHRLLRHSRLLLLIAALPAAARAQQIAFTFDDLPARNSLPPGVTRQQVAASIIAALQSAHLPIPLRPEPSINLDTLCR